MCLTNTIQFNLEIRNSHVFLTQIYSAHITRSNREYFITFEKCSSWTFGVIPFGQIFSTTICLSYIVAMLNGLWNGTQKLGCHVFAFVSCHYPSIWECFFDARHNRIKKLKRSFDTVTHEPKQDVFVLHGNGSMFLKGRLG